MDIFRITHVPFETQFNALNGGDTLDPIEWKGDIRLTQPGWQNRYEYEAKLVANVVENSPIKTILEIGSGPGVLSQLIQKELSYEVDYHLVDKTYAKQYFEEHNFKGKFLVKDISLDLDTSDLLPTYDLIICNDTLEHLHAPNNTLRKIHSLLSETSIFFVSVPNWRMAHQFIYRGLWDYDNFIYFLYIHGIDVTAVYPSILQTPYYPKMDSERAMPDELIQSWNFYFICKKRNI